VGEEFTVWERLGLLRHVGDGVDFHASLLIHGGVFCHHGSTAAYRASILQDASFVHAFTNDYWRGRLNSEDDQFLCRWLVNHDWKVALYSAEMRLVQTHSRASWRHMLQLLRWSRNDFRSSFAGLLWERKVWRYGIYNHFSCIHLLICHLDVHRSLPGFGLCGCYVLWRRSSKCYTCTATRVCDKCATTPTDHR
jgi:hypothetical protein